MPRIEDAVPTFKDRESFRRWALWLALGAVGTFGAVVGGTLYMNHLSDPGSTPAPKNLNRALGDGSPGGNRLYDYEANTRREDASIDMFRQANKFRAPERETPAVIDSPSFDEPVSGSPLSSNPAPRPDIPSIGQFKSGVQSGVSGGGGSSGASAGILGRSAGNASQGLSGFGGTGSRGTNTRSPYDAIGKGSSRRGGLTPSVQQNSSVLGSGARSFGGNAGWKSGFAVEDPNSGAAAGSTAPDVLKALQQQGGQGAAEGTPDISGLLQGIDPEALKNLTGAGNPANLPQTNSLPQSGGSFSQPLGGN